MGFRTKAMMAVGEGCLLLLCSLISLIDKKMCIKNVLLGTFGSHFTSSTQFFRLFK